MNHKYGVLLDLCGSIIRACRDNDEGFHLIPWVICVGTKGAVAVTPS